MNENNVNSYISTKLMNTLELDGNPIAVSITSDVPSHLHKWRRKSTICMLVQSARNGLSVFSSSNNIICNGKAHVGIGNSPSWDLENFLVRRERIVGSRPAARRMLDLAQGLSSDFGKYIILTPLMKANSDPDVVVFVGTPLQLSRILFLDAFETGEMDTIHREPLCSGVIATPIVTKQIGVSFLDMSCRSFGKYRPEEMAIGIPYKRVLKVVENIDNSIAGTAKSSLLLRILPKIMNLKR